MAEEADVARPPRSPRPPLPPGSTDKMRLSLNEGAVSSGDRSNGRGSSQLIPIHVVKTGMSTSNDAEREEAGAPSSSRDHQSSRAHDEGGADRVLRSGEAEEGAIGVSEGVRGTPKDDNNIGIFPGSSSVESRDHAPDTRASSASSNAHPESRGPGSPSESEKPSRAVQQMWNRAHREDRIPESPIQDSIFLSRISEGKAKVEDALKDKSIELTDINLSLTDLARLDSSSQIRRPAPAFVPLASLRGWQRLRRVAFHYVRFHMAFAKLRDMHVHWELDPGLLKKMEVLGEGCFAVCYRCQTIDAYGNKRELALKLLNHGSSDQDVDDFIRERDLMRKLRHTAIVEYYASGNIQFDAMHFPEMYLAMECMKGGSVRSMILKQMDSPHRKIYTKLDALRWLTDVAKGLHYLHSRSPCVIHRDLKPENIMLSNNVASQASAKVADFGLHCLVDREGTDPEDVYQLTGNTGSLMYMSPEVFRLEPYNEKADVFSFAINFWELFNCSLMIARITNMGTQEEVYNYACGVANGIRPRIPESWPFSVVSLVTDCWDPFPVNRPDFKEIVERLEACKEDVKNMDGNKGGSGGGACCCTVQ